MEIHSFQERLNREAAAYRRSFRLHPVADYFSVSIGQKRGNSINETIELQLRSMDGVSYPEIDWESELELSETSFLDFATERLTITMAYGAEILPTNTARDFLTEFKCHFGTNARFFTNSVILEDGRIDDRYSVTEDVFDCALIILGDCEIGVILMTDCD